MPVRNCVPQKCLMTLNTKRNMNSWPLELEALGRGGRTIKTEYVVVFFAVGCILFETCMSQQQTLLSLVRPDV